MFSFKHFLQQEAKETKRIQAIKVRALQLCACLAFTHFVMQCYEDAAACLASGALGDAKQHADKGLSLNPSDRKLQEIQLKIQVCVEPCWLDRFTTSHMLFLHINLVGPSNYVGRPCGAFATLVNIMMPRRFLCVCTTYVRCHLPKQRFRDFGPPEPYAVEMDFLLPLYTFLPP